MIVRTVELVPRALEAVQFAGDNANKRDIFQWVQDRTPQGKAVLSQDLDALYIQAVRGVEKVEEGEWILFDLTDGFLTSATDGAIAAFYRDVRDDEGDYDF
jgi:hypothetical protein